MTPKHLVPQSPQAAARQKIGPRFRREVPCGCVGKGEQGPTGTSVSSGRDLEMGPPGTWRELARNSLPSPWLTGPGGPLWHSGGTIRTVA